MIRAGFASRDITAPVGAEIPGSFVRRVNQGVLHPLEVSACVVDNGQGAVALVGVDALFVPGDLVRLALDRIESRTDLKRDQVLIGASHTHCGGPVFDGLASRADPAYVESVGEAIASAVVEAQAHLEESEIGIGLGQLVGISFNRRFLMTDGTEITHPGKPGTVHHDEIVAVAGPIDPTVDVLAVRNMRGEVTGIVVCFACHSTVVGGDLQTPDYAHYLRTRLRRHFGDGLPVVFLLGACGDVTQVDNMSEGSESGPSHAEMMGQWLAGEARRAVDLVDWLDEAAIESSVVMETLSIRELPDADAERPPFGLGSAPEYEPVYAQERAAVAEMRRANPTVETPIQALRIGPLGIVTNGSEFFCEYGLRIKRASPFSFTWVVSLANDYIGYVPTAQAFISGGYEPRTARSSFLAINAGQKIVTSSLGVLGELWDGERQGDDPILSLRGVGKGVWADEGADDYVDRLRQW
ncbi:MAG: hypothetical protein OXG11_12510 [Chloroflexi bacterium]|nr:hypothetical protein [Chloroflexota bacterium]